MSDEETLISMDLPDPERVLKDVNDHIVNETGSLLPLHNLHSCLVAYAVMRSKIIYLRELNDQKNELSKMIKKSMDEISSYQLEIK